MDLEGIILNEINQKEKDKYCMTSLICEILYMYLCLYLIYLYIERNIFISINIKKQAHRYKQQIHACQRWITVFNLSKLNLQKVIREMHIKTIRYNKFNKNKKN